MKITQPKWYIRLWNERLKAICFTCTKSIVSIQNDPSLTAVCFGLNILQTIMLDATYQTQCLTKKSRHTTYSHIRSN